MYYHNRVIICIDIDCFYAQVETVLDPTLKGLPLCVQQQNLAVTANYEARRLGVEKGIPIKKALEILPSIIVKNGEDILKYRIMSEKIYALFKQYSNLIEKLGLDENFIDVTSLVNDYIKDNSDLSDLSVVGHSIDDNVKCSCGCTLQLIVGSIIADRIRKHLFDELSITCTAGISYNKLLSKLAGAQHKPNMQTTCFPNAAQRFLSNLNHLRMIPGIGHATEKKLIAINIDSIDKCRYANIDTLKGQVGATLATSIKDWCLGIDESDVKVIEKVKSIGCEDTIKIVYSRNDIMSAARTLLIRLWNLVKRDNRIPTTMKLTIRKKNLDTNINERFSREITFDSTFLGTNNSCFDLDNSQENKLMGFAATLLQKIINSNEPIEVNLVGLSFSSFHDNNNDNNNNNSNINKRKQNDNDTNDNSKKQSKINNFFIKK